MLDIIIPTYNDKDSLIRSLRSIAPVFCKDKIHVTIVDDGSNNPDFSIIENMNWDFDLQILYLKENCGPGIARQYGIDHTKHDYITFIDAGDIFKEFINCDCIIYQLNAMPYKNLFIWPLSHLNTDLIEEIDETTNNYLSSKVFKREFLNKYNITFNNNKIGSYAVEDVGFCNTCRMIIEDKCPETLHLGSRIMTCHIHDNPNSLTSKNNDAYQYNINDAYAYNIEHELKILTSHDVSKKYINEQAFIFLVRLYYDYLQAMIYRPEFTEKQFNALKYYYFNVFKKYSTESIDTEHNRSIYITLLQRCMDAHPQGFTKKYVSIDLYGFINELEKA